MEQTNHVMTSVIFTGPTQAQGEGIIQGIYTTDQKSWGYLIILPRIGPKIRKQVKSPKLRRHEGGKHLSIAGRDSFLDTRA